jgi:hypothetical protein
MTRGGGRRKRAIQIDHALPDNVDQDIFKRNKAWSKSAYRPRQTLGTASHVLLAACGASESAFEDDGRGAFTRALLDVMKLGCRKLTYSEIIQKIPSLAE